MKILSKEGNNTIQFAIQTAFPSARLIIYVHHRHYV